MRIIPVIDLMNGRAVRAVGGRRDEYRPLEPESDPVAVARALLSRSSADTLYVADLDAITGRAACETVLDRLGGLGAALWVDVGVRDIKDAARWIRRGATVVLGSETLDGPDVVAESVAIFGAEHVVFSLDMQGDKVLHRGDWPRGSNPAAVASEAVQAGVRRVIVLDLRAVGGRAGSGTESLLAAFAADHPGVEWIAGGGVRDRRDLARLSASGVSAALVATALHEGRLP